MPDVSDGAHGTGGDGLAAHENSVLGTVSKLIAPSDPLFRAPTDADLRDNFTLQHQRFARLQLQLSLKMGGCGIASTVMTAPLANIAAWRSCLSFLAAHGDLFPSVSGLVSSDALAAADGDAPDAEAGPLDFLAQSWAAAPPHTSAAARHALHHATTFSTRRPHHTR